jgi:hypothetical protein
MKPIVVGEGSGAGIGGQGVRMGEVLLPPIASAQCFASMERVKRIFLVKGLSRIVRPRGARSAAPAADALSRNAPFGNTGALPTRVITGGLRIR